MSGFKIRDLESPRRVLLRSAWCTKPLLGVLVACALASAPASASLYALPADGSAVVGTDGSIRTVYEDTLPDLAQRYSLGYYEIIRANPGVDVWIPGADRHLTLPGRRILPPGPREGGVVTWFMARG